MKNLLKIVIVTIVLLNVTVACKKDVHVTCVTLDIQSITLTVGATETLTATVQPDNAPNKVVSWKSSNTTVADVANNGVVTAKEAGTATITVTTEDNKYTATCLVTVKSAWVVINGVKWATRNVDKPGTFAAKPEDTGMFYQWNRNVGWSATDSMINSNGSTIWDSTLPICDSWEKANVPCPKGWRIPTKEELQSLVNAGSEWTIQNGVNGRLFGNDDNKLFFPATGCRHYSNGTLGNVGSHSDYWSATINGSEDAYFMYIYCGLASMGSYYRSNGFSVRCVSE